NNYYLITLAPAVAALAGIGVTTAWRAARGGRRWAWLLLPAVLLTAVAQSSAVHADPVEAAGWEWLVPLTWTGAALVAGATVYVLRRGGATFAIERPAATGAGAPAPMAAVAAIGVAALLAGSPVGAGGPAL